MVSFISFFFNITVDSVPLIICLNFSTVLVVVGLVGIVWNKRNLLIMLLCIELMFFSIGLTFVFFSIGNAGILGQLCMLLILTSATAETAIGVSLLVVVYRLTSKSSYDLLTTLRG